MKNKTIYNVLGFVLVIAVVAAFIIGVVVDDIPIFCVQLLFLLPLREFLCSYGMTGLKRKRIL